jgi:hypothetical protein|tara:strand:- start:144 stop:491 length:348 start_codon:yes stop_codon:yes gene_type:complete
MKLTKQYLTKVIREEINKTVKEYAGDTAALEMSGGKEGFDLTPGGRQRTDSKKMSADTGAAEKALDKQAQLKRLLSKVDRREELEQMLPVFMGALGDKLKPGDIKRVLTQYIQKL